MLDVVTLDFESAESQVLLNPRMPAEERARLESMVPDLAAHMFVATSGSSGVMKLVALSKRAILASAAAVNERLNVTSSDVWSAVLPVFHVGGIGVYARCHLSGARPLAMAWDARTFADSDATIASLVPAQVHDLLAAKLAPSAHLRAILVGGGAFDAAPARAAGWPVLPSYGMSECCSTVAIEDQLLPHLEARCEPDARIAIRGTSLLTGYVTAAGVVDPKIDGWFLTEDLGEISGRTLRVRGRAGEFVKIGGESVDLARLDNILADIAGDSAAIVALPDVRLGHVIALAATANVAKIADAFNARVHPFERIRATYRVGEIPRSPLGKLLRTQLAVALR
jgi:O-succinylbenzoic acid--CoA ligase